MKIESIKIQLDSKTGRYRWELHKSFGYLGTSSLYHSASSCKEAISQILQEIQRSEQGSEKTSEKSVDTCSSIW